MPLLKTTLPLVKNALQCTFDTSNTNSSSFSNKFHYSKENLRPSKSFRLSRVNHNIDKSFQKTRFSIKGDKNGKD